MSANKKIVETFSRARDLAKLGPLLTEASEWIEWHDGVPVGGVVTKGKAAMLEHLSGGNFETEVTRMTEEGNVVVVEGVARGHKDQGGIWTLRFCNIVELEDGRIKRMTSFGAQTSG